MHGDRIDDLLTLRREVVEARLVVGGELVEQRREIVFGVGRAPLRQDVVEEHQRSRRPTAECEQGLDSLRRALDGLEDLRRPPLLGEAEQQLLRLVLVKPTQLMQIPQLVGRRPSRNL